MLGAEEDDLRATQIEMTIETVDKNWFAQKQKDVTSKCE